MDRIITRCTTDMIQRIQAVMHLTETQIGQIISVSQSSIAKWKKRYAGQQTRPNRCHFKKLVQLYRISLQIELGATLNYQDSETGLVLNVERFEHACNLSDAYPSNDHVVAARDLKRAAAAHDPGWRVQILVVPLPPKVDARIYRVPGDLPKRFVILLSESLDMTRRRTVLMHEFFAHVSNCIADDANEGGGYENSTPDCGQ